MSAPSFDPVSALQKPAGGEKLREMGRIFLISISVLMLFALRAECQMFNAVPVMTVPVSVEANGMGSISASVNSTSSLASIANPAQLGIFTFDRRFSISTYITNGTPLVSSGTDNSLFAISLGGGVNLARDFGFPAPLSFGIGYSRIALDIGKFEIPFPGSRRTFSSWHASQTMQTFTLATGLDYWIRLGVGYNFNWVHSGLSYLYPEANVPSGEAGVFANDYGITVTIPTIDILSRLDSKTLRITKDVTPVVDLTFAYVKRNIGSGIYYYDPAQAQPLPRRAVIGMGLELGFTGHVSNMSWTLFSITWAREASCPLVRQSLDSTVYVNPGFGDSTYDYSYHYPFQPDKIQPFDNLVLGRSRGNVDLSKGWQIQLAEMLYVRGGAYSGEDGTNYSTFGSGLRFDGIVKFLAYLNVVDIERPGICSFLLDHLDLEYDYNEYTSTRDPNISATSLQSLNLVLR